MENASGTPCQTCYLNYDQIGSVRLVTDQNAAVVARHDYVPYGEEIVPPYAGRSAPFGNTDYVDPRFTGQMRDSENQLDFFNARYFGPGLGRFESPDPMNAGASEGDPRSWNGYAYVLGNPLALVDPSGLFGQNPPAVQAPTTDLCTVLIVGAENVPQAANPCMGGSVASTYNGPLPSGAAGSGGGGSSFSSSPAKSGTRPDWLNKITSIFGYDQRIKLPSCAALAFSIAADDLNPFSPGTFGAVKDSIQAALSTGELYYFNAAISHATARGLTYPNKSSIFRGLLNKSSSLGKAGGSYLGWLAVDGALGHGFAREMFAMSRGECQ